MYRNRKKLRSKTWNHSAEERANHKMRESSGLRNEQRHYTTVRNIGGSEVLKRVVVKQGLGFFYLGDTVHPSSDLKLGSKLGIS